jgi:hypothetical protein
MADYTDTKAGLGRILPSGALEVVFEDQGPLITPQELKDLYLWGVPLVSALKNPVTRQYDVMTDDMLKRYIVEAVATCEAEGKFSIFPVQRIKKHAFDRAEYTSFGYFQLRDRPVSSIQKLTVTASNEQAVFIIPLEWIDVGQLHQGQVNIIPLTMYAKNGSMTPLLAGPGGATMLNLWGGSHWLASFWEFTYTTGFPDGKLPKLVNQYIGTVAAMRVLSLLATTHAKTTSTSLSLDGASQSISGPGPNLYDGRIKALAQERKETMRKLQSNFGCLFCVDSL